MDYWKNHDSGQLNVTSVEIVGHAVDTEYLASMWKVVDTAATFDIGISRLIVVFVNLPTTSCAYPHERPQNARFLIAKASSLHAFFERGNRCYLLQSQVAPGYSPTLTSAPRPQPLNKCPVFASLCVELPPFVTAIL